MRVDMLIVELQKPNIVSSTESVVEMSCKTRPDAAMTSRWLRQRDCQSRFDSVTAVWLSVCHWWCRSIIYLMSVDDDVTLRYVGDGVTQSALTLTLTVVWWWCSCVMSSGNCTCRVHRVTYNVPVLWLTTRVTFTAPHIWQKVSSQIMASVDK